MILLIFLTTTSGVAQSENKLSLGEQPIFKVSKTTEPIIVDGKMDEAIWSKTEARTLEYFYRVEAPSDQQQTTFRMLWDNENMYVFFHCEDSYITARETKRDGSPYFDDCAEIFLIPAPDSLDTHFGFELNLFKASNDFIYFNDYYKEQDAVFRAFNPDFEAEVTFDGTINNNSDVDKGWTMELAIPLSTFGALGSIEPVEEGNRWAFLAVRQDRNDPDGDRRSTSTLFPIYDIAKNVHQVNRFGLMEFVK
ncbi:MAG: carbohydrate-binding family 9-like protein [Cyclobacteriaceae bacterium]